jgi:hypothetical protein
MWRLRRAGFTLRGNFSSENFLVYRPKQQKARKRGRAQVRRPDRRPAEDWLVVRMTGRLHLSLYNREDAVEDDRTFVWCVREVLNIREHVPLEISDWLHLINYRGVGREYLVRYHISLMDPRAALAVLMSYRRRIEYLMRRRPDIYASIVHMMAPRYQRWNSRTLHFTNTLMEAARLHVLSQNNKTQEEGFDPNVRGILTVVRNCSEHPAKRFEQYMLLILEEDFRGFAARLHSIMFRTGQLQFLHLENTMG